MSAVRYACCDCCKTGIDPWLHDDPAFAGHEIGCDSCRNFTPWGTEVSS